MSRIYGNGTDSTIGNQLQEFYFEREALIDLKKEVYFSPHASTKEMPKHFGKRIKMYHYLPMLDERNLSNQGIDAAGALMSQTLWYVFTKGAMVPSALVLLNEAGFASETICRTAIAAAVTASRITQTEADGYAVTLGAGNLYGSSKDVGTIAAKLPALTENGGRVNRVGFSRIELEGSLEKFGFYQDYTQESVDFDTDEQLNMHVNREMIRASQEITEDALQIDILNSAGVHRFAGTATTMATISGATGAVCEVTYADLSALAIELDNNRTPKETKVITGTRMTDTKVIPAARALLVGSEMIPTIERMTDHFGDQAFIRVAHYAAGTSVMNGEIGTIGYFRIIVVPEMMHWAGKGAVEGTNAGYQVENGKYNVYPMLVIGSESFTTIGFQSSGTKNKFKIKHAKPGSPESYANDPYGETGFMSIKWYYGFMGLRTERIALVYSVGRI